jgi:hypothetical protein
VLHEASRTPKTGHPRWSGQWPRDKKRYGQACVNYLGHYSGRMGAGTDVVDCENVDCASINIDNVYNACESRVGC